MSGSLDLSVVIVNWNTRDYLASCLTSIRESLSGPDTQVVVVDNASAHGSAQMVRERFPGARLVANTENRGVAGGVNDGIAIARGRCCRSRTDSRGLSVDYARCGQVRGAFDEAYRLFFEDVDWCSRARGKGFKLKMLSCLEVIHSGGRSFAVDNGNWIQARYFVSLVTYFSRRKSQMAAVAGALIICVNALLVIARISPLRGWGSAESQRQAALSRRTYRNVLRLFYRAFVLRRNEVPVP
jgi:GT2 family glycosyltransferase